MRGAAMNIDKDRLRDPVEFYIKYDDLDEKFRPQDIKGIHFQRCSNRLGVFEVEMENGDTFPLSAILRGVKEVYKIRDVASDAYKDGFDAALAALQKFLPREFRYYKGFGRLKSRVARKSPEDYVPYPEIPKLPEVWVDIRKRILERDNFTCHYCKGKAVTADHKTPVVSGGTDDDENLVAACQKCNFDKKTMSYEKYMAKIGQEAR